MEFYIVYIRPQFPVFIIYRILALISNIDSLSVLLDIADIYRNFKKLININKIINLAAKIY